MKTRKEKIPFFIRYPNFPTWVSLFALVASLLALFLPFILK